MSFEIVINVNQQVGVFWVFFVVTDKAPCSISKNG